ncbi:hypothetical protein ACIQM4_07565 [Streptomyces sp. NPDC091272]|uniref:hypothetical protein n=1 Tax=Streptomyces sp. NPDC091272 TaxID=3365981 RepID=UPI00380CF11C
MAYFKGLYRSVALFLPLLSLFVLSHLIWGASTAMPTKLLASLGMLGGLLLLGVVRWKVYGPPVEPAEAAAAYRRELLAPGERLKLVVPVREAEGSLPYALLRRRLWLALSDRTVVVFSYDRNGPDAVLPLWSTGSAGAALQGGRVMLPDGLGRTRSVVVPTQFRGDFEYWQQV